MNSLGLVVLAWTALAAIQEAEAWFWGGGYNGKCQENHAGRQMYPYYFGKTDLTCLLLDGKKGKRSAPSVNTWSWSHSYVKYRDSYFEFSNDNKGHVGTVPLGYGRCSTSTSSSVTGYGVLSVDCIKKCAENYSRQFGTYSLLGNNCHDFANKLSEVLCNYNYCPSWCQ